MGDRRRIAHHLEPARTIAIDATIRDAPPGGNGDPIAVLDAAGVLLGSIDGAAARRLPADTPAHGVMVPAPGTIRPELRVDEVATRLRDDGLDHVFVTAVSGVLLGIVHRERLHV